MAGEWLLLINTLYNLILITFTSSFTQIPVSPWRKWLIATGSSFFGLLLFPSILSPIVSFLLLLVAFPTARQKHAVILLIGSFSVGGLLTAIQAYANTGKGMHIVWFGLSILLLLYIGRAWRLRWRLAQRQFIVSCEINLDAQMFQLEGFVDTGNSCIEPISAMPVHFIAMPAIEQRLSPIFVAMLKAGQRDESGMFREVYLSTVHGEKPVLVTQAQEITIGERSYKGHYIAFIEKQPKFGQTVDVILHCSMLPND